MEARQWDDETLIDQLRQALQFVGPVDLAVAAGTAVFTWRTIDEELARASLVFDSMVENTTRHPSTIRRSCSSSKRIPSPSRSRSIRVNWWAKWFRPPPGRSNY